MEVILMFAGQLGCEALNFVLKRIIKEERPRGKSSVQSSIFSSYSVNITAEN